MDFKHILCIFTVFVTLPMFIEAELYCYQCDSRLDPNCQEKWDHSLKVNQEKYKLCQLWDANYCTKVTGMWGGVVGTHRFCSSKDLGDQCQDIWFPDHNRMYRACVYSCSSDGCNGAGTFTLNPVIAVAVLMSALVTVVRLL